MCIAACLNLVNKYFGKMMKPIGLLGGSSMANSKKEYTVPDFSREPEIAYQAHFEAEKVRLSMGNGVYFDENAEESIC